MAHDAIMEEKRERLAGLGEPARTTVLPSAPLRSPDITNRTERLGAMHGTTVSFDGDFEPKAGERLYVDWDYVFPQS